MTDHRWRRVLITGAAGRIGSTLRAGLIGRHELFRLIDRRPIADIRADEEAVIADLSDEEALTRVVAGVDAMIHLAGAPDPKDFERMYQVNVRGLFDIFEAARKAGSGASSSLPQTTPTACIRSSTA